ncbi:MAG: DMT family transporter, partial [Ardenticatenales bacterium]|nr:DMT family transporter [Ardenticatenales bacterium]
LVGRSWAALLLTLLGIALTIPELGSGFQGSDPLGLGLGLLNAALYASYIILSSQFLRGQSALALASAWSITGSLLLLLALALLRGLAWPVGVTAWGSVLALATVSTVMPIFTFYAGMQRVGAARAAILSTVEPLLTVMLAMILLGESMTPRQWLGGGLILISILLLQGQGKAATPGRNPLPAEGDRSQSLVEPEHEVG